jgi:hypothetical protein
LVSRPRCPFLYDRSSAETYKQNTDVLEMFSVVDRSTLCILGTSHDSGHDVFISHAKTLKHLAKDLERELGGLGFTVFLDETSLHPGDNADKIMLESVRKALVGLVLFDENYVVRDWPMAELKLIVEAGTLLPIAIGMSHTEFKIAWQRSPVASRHGEALFDVVTRTTFVKDQGGWQGEMRERICLEVTRVFVKKICPRLQDTGRSMLHKLKTLRAAKAIMCGRLKTLTVLDIEEATEWVARFEQNLRHDGFQVRPDLDTLESLVG